ncbi:MAG TPA: glycosyltransferase [Flavitalea sp.]|nr:glycosyltransferase [Flavitalea sp.]
MSTPRKTLVILTPAFPGSESETVWVRPKQLFVRKLQESFPSLQIIILSFNYPFHTSEYRWHGISVFGFNGMYTRKLKRLYLWIRVWRKLKELNKQLSLLGIFSFWCGECALVGKKFADRYGLKHFTWISGMDAKKENKLMKWIRPDENELVAMSFFLQNEFQKNHLVKPRHVIPIGIDPFEYSEITADSRDVDILGVGTLNPFKQYDVFINIIKDITVSFPEVKAVICGEGDDRPRLEAMIKELRLENNISLTGLIPHADVLNLMQRSRVFLHPSSYEGFGAVCLEALYAGAFVISFCDPMHLSVDRWHIAKNPGEMKNKAMEILESNNIVQKSVLLYSMDDTANAVMKLFEH